jgi:hypothetical protein
MQTNFSSGTKQNIAIDCKLQLQLQSPSHVAKCKCKEKRKWTMNDKDKRQATSSIGTCIWRKLHLPRNNNNRPLLYHGQMDNINININIT